MAAACFHVTYTQDGHKKLRKNWKWFDGFVTQSGRDAKLYNEGGSLVATACLSLGEALEEGGEVARSFGASVVVAVDAPCTPADIYGDGGGGGAAAPAALPPSPAGGAGGGAGPTAAVAAKPRMVGAALRGVGSGSKRPTFKAPRPLPAAAPPAHMAAAAASAPAPCVQPERRPFLAPARRAPAAQLPLAVAAQPSVLPSGAPTFRSDDDILRLLTGQAPLVQHSAPGPMAPPAAGGPNAEAQPAAKRQRVQPPLQAAAATATAAPAAAPKWAGFVADDEDELAGLAVPVPAAQHSPDAGVQQKQQRQLQRQGWGQRQQSAWGQPELAADELDISSMGSQGAAGGGSRPVVRPPQAADVPQQAWPPPPPPQQQQQAAPIKGTQGQPPQPPQQQGGWERFQQREPLQPSRQAQQQQQPLARPAAAAGGAWKPPAQVPAAANGGPSRLAIPAAATAAAAAVGAGGGGGWNPDGVQLQWPGDAGRPARRVTIPDAFASSQQYVQAWSHALLEELNLRIADIAQAFYTAVAQAGQQQQQQQQHPPQAGYGGVRKPGGSGAGGAAVVGSALEARLRQARVVYSSNCELFIWKNLPKRGNWDGKGGKRRRGGGKGEGAEEDEETEEAGKKPESVYLILKGGRQKSAEYRKDDLWIISNNPAFCSSFAPGQLGDRSRAPWVAVARSLWHGPNQDGKFEVEFLSRKPDGLGNSQAVHAIKGPDASTELQMIDLLRGSAAPSALPLLPHLLRSRGAALAPSRLPGPSAAAGQPLVQPEAGLEDPLGDFGSPCYSGTDDDEVLPAPAVAEALEAVGVAADGLEESPLLQAERIIHQFSLNQEQGEVLQYVASWQMAPGSAASAGASKWQASSAATGNQTPPVCLVHGPFGSGKSTLLVALLHFLLLQRARAGSPLAGARVLVSAHTNVAVDRVLLGLRESGCTDFLRVGPLRRLDGRLLPQSLHASESRTNATSASELKEMLKETSSPAERAAIETELVAAERGADRQRKRLLKTVPVVGVTCCSSMLSALDGQQFDVAVLDECSQMVEPLPLLLNPAHPPSNHRPQFDVVVLDECSQMVEPMSLVPLLRARAKFLIAAGDPLQLPPVICSPAHVTPAGGAHGGPRGPPQQQEGRQPQGLLRPLFVRLAALGLPPFLLRRQYRCHPDISAVPNAQFYGGRLLDGCSREQRASLLPGLPSLVFLDVRGQEQYGAGRSASNQQEADAVAAAVERLVAAGVKLGQIGVICFFRAQVALVRQVLERRLPQLQAQQQRRPQAAALAGDGSSESSEGEALGPPGSGGRGGLGSQAAAEDEEGSGGGSQEQQAVQVATVDSFQGAERDCIILTTTVTRGSNFASDACRLNVALTRAKRNLLVVGHAPALQQSAPAFAALLGRCRGTPGGYSPSGRLPVVAAPPAALPAAPVAVGLLPFATCPLLQ